MREVKLPSGAILVLNPAPFADSKALYQAVLKEAKGVAFTTKVEMGNVYKDLFCAGFSSPEIEKCLWVCMPRCTYNKLKITEDTFEPVSAREDFIIVCMEVAKENIHPFVKSLFAEWSNALESLTKSQK